MRRLEELLRQMCQASKAIGNTELENKFAEGIFSSFYFDLFRRERPQMVLVRVFVTTSYFTYDA